MGYCKGIKEGAIKSQEVRKVMMKMPEEIYANTSVEILQVLKKHIEKFLGRVPKVGESTLELADQLHARGALEAEPSIVEIDDATRKLNFTASGHDGITAGT